MKNILFSITLVFSFQAFASTSAEILRDLLNDPQTLSQEAMRETGRIGELNTRSRIVAVNNLTNRKGFVNVVDGEIKRMDEKEELFRHEKGTINNLYSLIRDGSYQVIYKTGRDRSYSQYASDGIEDDLLSIVTSATRKEVKRLLKGAQYSYLRTYTTVGEYDGMEKFFLKVSETEVVVLTIDNCGGC